MLTMVVTVPAIEARGPAFNLSWQPWLLWP